MSWEVPDLDVSLLDNMTKLEIQLEIYDVILIGILFPLYQKMPTWEVATGSRKYCQGSSSLD